MDIGLRDGGVSFSAESGRRPLIDHVGYEPIWPCADRTSANFQAA
jgi:hypothetical protein